MDLRKTVDRTRAKPYDVLRYALSYSNSGTAYATNSYIVDHLPDNTTYLTNSAEVSNAPHGGVLTIEYWNGTNWRASGYDQTNSTAISIVRWTIISNILATQRGTVLFRVLIR